MKDKARKYAVRKKSSGEFVDFGFDNGVCDYISLTLDISKTSLFDTDLQIDIGGWLDSDMDKKDFEIVPVKVSYEIGE